MSTPARVTALGLALWGERTYVCLDLHVEEDPDGKWQVAEVFATRNRSGNAPVDQRYERRSVRVKHTGMVRSGRDNADHDGGLVAALDALAGKLTEELTAKGVRV